MQIDEIGHKLAIHISDKLTSLYFIVFDQNYGNWKRCI